MGFVWIETTVVLAIHDAQLAEHGGLAGVQDAGLLESALARPQNLLAYGAPDCAAAYGFGIARNQPFIDGNKRTAFVCTELFLALNGYELTADDVSCVTTMLNLAAGEIDEAAFAAWLRAHLAAR
ncbi:MAG: type II toxin-antitoxin system death-on-curing family toxin [Rhodocyclales bacterium]|nr:type II toxin-antitoxin system death-on-curing family toxin [Rhodocyclales bacterium]